MLKLSSDFVLSTVSEFFWKIASSRAISETLLLCKVSKFFLFWSIRLGYNETWYCLLLALFTTYPFSHCSQIFPSSLPTSAWGRCAELLSKHRKTVRKLYHGHVVSPRRCFSIGKSMRRWKKSIGNELRRRLWSNASWTRRWERYSKITDCWYLMCWGDTEVTG